MVRIPKYRVPTHPGEILLEEFLVPMLISQRDLAQAVHVPYQRINEIVNGKRGVTPRTALRLANPRFLLPPVTRCKSTEGLPEALQKRYIATSLRTGV